MFIELLDEEEPLLLLVDEEGLALLLSLRAGEEVLGLGVELDTLSNEGVLLVLEWLSSEGVEGRKPPLSI